MRRVLFLLALAVFSTFIANSTLVASEKVLYSFTGTPDGREPIGPLVRDAVGNLYGTTYSGGSSGINGNACDFSAGCGVVFKLKKMSGGQWKESVIYNFCPVIGCIDGANPAGGLVIDAAGNLYGTTYNGGAGEAGVVFELVEIGGTWEEIVLHHFCTEAHCVDGAHPDANLILDGAGNLWGTTYGGGGSSILGGAGVVFEISPVSGGWVETVLYPFCLGESCWDGVGPRAAVTLDLAGNVYGTTSAGGSVGGSYGGGVVYELAPALTGYWPYTSLYDFCPVVGCLDGETPLGGVTFDLLGHLYGTANAGGTKGYGVLFRLTLTTSGEWNYTILHNFCSSKNCADGAYPFNGLIFDSAGNLYGTTFEGGSGANGGVVFKLIPKLGAWQEDILYSFCSKGVCLDGEQPSGTLIMDPQKNLYGVTSGGGANGGGAVFEITP